MCSIHLDRSGSPRRLITFTDPFTVLRSFIFHYGSFSTSAVKKYQYGQYVFWCIKSFWIQCDLIGFNVLHMFSYRVLSFFIRFDSFSLKFSLRKPIAIEIPKKKKVSMKLQKVKLKSVNERLLAPMTQMNPQQQFIEVIQEAARNLKTPKYRVENSIIIID